MLINSICQSVKKDFSIEASEHSQPMLPQESETQWGDSHGIYLTSFNPEEWMSERTQ